MNMTKRNCITDARGNVASFVLKHRDLLLGAVLWTAVILIEAVIALYDLRVYSVRSGFWQFFSRRMLFPTLPFLVVFAVHDFLLAPLLVNRKKTASYLICTLALLGIFSAYMLCFDSPGRPGRFENEPPERGGFYGVEPPGPFAGRGDGELAGAFAEGENSRNTGPSGSAGRRPDPPGPRERDGGFGTQDEGGRKEPPGRDDAHPADPGIFKIFLAAMMLAANLGWKYYISYSREKHRLESLEKENLQYRLECLRYQINPHFFMNTLNNIHALVDLSPEKAKESIVELSRLMRHVLYDSSAPTAELSKEIDFLKHYIYLMRLRYTENVRIDCKFPDGPVTAQAPPLLMSTIVENAFKHGVSGGGDSFISLSVSVEGGKVIFRCVNSLAAKSGLNTSGGGVGLENIGKRLSLLYGDRYLLHIDRKENEYDVLLVFPAEPETGTAGTPERN